jgi:hypothetical protein
LARKNGKMAGSKKPDLGENETATVETLREPRAT